MFKANSPSVYVPSKSVAIKPDVVSDAVGNDQIRINIPSFIGFCDPNQTYLKFNLKMKNVRGQLVPDRMAGGHALIRNVQYRDGNNSTNLEINEDYNANYCMLSNYTAQDGINHKRELFAGKMSHLAIRERNETLYYGTNPVPGGSFAVPNTEKRVVKNPTLQFQLNSGIFKQGKILPVSAMNGLKITIDTEDINRAFMYLDSFGDSDNIHTRKIKLMTAGKAVGDDARTAAANARQFNVSVDCSAEDNPFCVGDSLYVADDGPTLLREERLGYINGFSTVGGGLGIVYTPDRNLAAGLTIIHAVGSLVYTKFADRMVAATVFGVNDAGNAKSRVIEAPSYAMNDIEMLVQSVSPPEAYANGILKASQSSGGIQFDFMTYELYRHNQSNTTGLLQAQIPTMAKRAKAVFVHPLVAANNRNALVSSLVGVPDNARNYEFVHGTKHFPSRLVPLSRYSAAVGATDQLRNEALHTSELQKAIVNVGEKVHSLQKIGNHFVIARSLSKYGGTMDLSEETLSIRIDYDTGANVKLFNNYVYCLRRVMIKGGQVEASNQVEASQPSQSLEGN